MNNTHDIVLPYQDLVDWWWQLKLIEEHFCGINKAHKDNSGKVHTYKEPAEWEQIIPLADLPPATSSQPLIKQTIILPRLPWNYIRYNFLGDENPPSGPKGGVGGYLNIYLGGNAVGLPDFSSYASYNPNVHVYPDNYQAVLTLQNIQDAKHLNVPLSPLIGTVAFGYMLYNHINHFRQLRDS